MVARGRTARDRDAAQRAHDLMVDDRYAIPVQPVRHIRPGDPGFEAVAATVTPLEKIRNATTAEDIHFLMHSAEISWEV